MKSNKKTPNQLNHHLSPAQKQEIDAEIQKVKQSLKTEIRKVKTKKLTPLAKALLGNLSLPADAPPVRVGSVFGSDPTALASLRSRETVVFPRAGVPNEIPETDYLAFQFRDPLRNLVSSTGLPAGSGTVVSYEAYWEVEAFSSTEVSYPDYRTPFVPSNNDTSKIHGPAMFLGVLGESDRMRGFHVSRGMTTNVVIQGPYPPNWTIAYVDLYKLEGKNWSKHRTGGAAVAPPQVFVFSNLETGYYAIALRSQSTSEASGASTKVQGYTEITMPNVGGTVEGMVWSHKAAPQVFEFRDNIETFTVLGTSLMYTNTASPLNRQGKLLAREMPAKTFWHNFLDFDTVANMSLAVVKDAPLGIYGFVRPSGETVGRFRTLSYVTDQLDNLEREFLFNIFPEEPYMLIHASVNTAAGRDAYLTRAISFEYTSLTMFIQQATGGMTEEELHEALKLLALVPQFHDNPFHFEDVWGWIKDTAKDVWSAVKDVAPLAIAAAPLLL